MFGIPASPQILIRAGGDGVIGWICHIPQQVYETASHHSVRRGRRRFDRSPVSPGLFSQRRGLRPMASDLTFRRLMNSLGRVAVEDIGLSGLRHCIGAMSVGQNRA